MTMKTVVTTLTLLIATLMTAQPNTPQSTVDVSGEGIVRVVPDEVTITVSVENEGKDAKLLKQQNDATISEVLQFLKSQNIDEKYISTQYVRLNKNYNYNTKTYNYTASQTLSVQLKDLSNYEAVMNGLVASGVNRIGGISFASSKKASLEAEARKKAVLDAKQKASEYASALGQSIGKAVSISEFQPQINNPGPMYRSAMSMDTAESGGNQQTLSPGEMEIQVRVNVRFELN